MAIPVASVVLLWRLLFDDQGLWNHLLHMLSVQTTDWMNTGASFYVLVISYIWRNLGYDVVLWMAGLSAIPAALYEAAKVEMFYEDHTPEYAPVPFYDRGTFCTQCI